VSSFTTSLPLNFGLSGHSIWDKLGFTRAGLIPKAGRLKKRDGEGEEYVDALVYYKSFE